MTIVITTIASAAPCSRATGPPIGSRHPASWPQTALSIITVPLRRSSASIRLGFSRDRPAHYGRRPLRSACCTARNETDVAGLTTMPAVVVGAAAAARERTSREVVAVDVVPHAEAPQERAGGHGSRCTSTNRRRTSLPGNALSPGGSHSRRQWCSRPGAQAVPATVPGNDHAERRPGVEQVAHRSHRQRRARHGDARQRCPAREARLEHARGAIDQAQRRGVEPRRRPAPATGVGTAQPWHRRSRRPGFRPGRGRRRRGRRAARPGGPGRSGPGAPRRRRAWRRDWWRRGEARASHPRHRSTRRPGRRPAGRSTTAPTVRQAKATATTDPGRRRPGSARAATSTMSSASATARRQPAGAGTPAWPAA